MKRLLGCQALIIAVASLISFTALGNTWLWDEDEAFFAASAAEMHRSDSWIVPTFNEDLFAHKPPFMYWMMRIGFLLFGQNEFGARFFSGIFGMATALVTFHIGRTLFSERAGVWAGLALSTGIMWTVVARASTADAYLGFFIASSLLVYVRSVFKDRGDAPATSSLKETLEVWLPHKWSTYVGMYVLMGMAVLVKGPIGVLLPGATIGLFLLGQAPAGIPQGVSLFKATVLKLIAMIKAFPATFWAMRPLTALACVLAVAGPWFITVSLRTGGEFMAEFIGVHNVGRFMQVMENHRGPIFYYIPVIAVGFFPWSIFAMPTALQAFKRTENKSQWLFLMCWAGWMIGFFSIASTKLPNYTLPAYPALALMTGAWLDAWCLNRTVTSPRWPWLSFGTLAGTGIILSAGILATSLISIGDQPLLEKLGVNASLVPILKRLVWLGALPTVAGGVIWVMLRNNQRVKAVWTTVAASALFTASVLIGAASIVNPLQTSAPLTEALPEETPAGSLAAFRYFPPSLIYYAEQRVERAKTNKDAVNHLEGPGQRYLFTTDAGLEQIRELTDRPLKTLESLPRFPRTGKVLLISSENPPASAMGASESKASSIASRQQGAQP